MTLNGTNLTQATLLLDTYLVFFTPLPLLPPPFAQRYSGSSLWCTKGHCEDFLSLTLSTPVAGNF